MVNYYRPETSTEISTCYTSFINRFARLMNHINTLLQGNKKRQLIQWATEAADAFVQVKNARILCSPDCTKSFIIQSDASDVTIGILKQEINGSEKIIAYASHHYVEVKGILT